MAKSVVSVSFFPVPRSESRNTDRLAAAGSFWTTLAIVPWDVLFYQVTTSIDINILQLMFATGYHYLAEESR